MKADVTAGVPVLFSCPSKCCGCTACMSICARSAISMCPDEEGFDFPIVDQLECTRCLLCIRVCPMKAEHAKP